MICGATGEGKTVAGLWHLSNRNFHQMPWCVLNWKREKMIDAIPAPHVDLNVIPRAPGIYVYHPRPDQTQWVDNLLYHVWERGNCGVFFDEGYMIGQHSDANRLLLTQGRSLRCPLITLTQRPAWIDVFTFSESEYYQMFRLRRRLDQKTMAEYAPGYNSASLRPYYSFWYDVRLHQLTPLQPVPKFDTVLETFRRRLSKRKIAV